MAGQREFGLRKITSQLNSANLLLFELVETKVPAVLIDKVECLKTLIAHIDRQPVQEQLVFLDLEGVNLGRDGTLAIIQVLLPPDPTVFLIDVSCLGGKAFDTTAGKGPSSLRSVLESQQIPKILFDLRRDSDALYSLYQVNLGCVVDLQLLEFATRRPRGQYVSGLAKCVTYESGKLPLYTADWPKVKEAGVKLFAPEKGGSYKVFLERPLRQELIDYCEQDVLLMPGLLALYASRLVAGAAVQLQSLADDRIRLSQSPFFNGKGHHMAIGPKLRRFTEVRNISLSYPMTLICSSKVHELCFISSRPRSTEVETSDRAQSVSDLNLLSSMMLGSVSDAMSTIEAKGQAVEIDDIPPNNTTDDAINGYPDALLKYSVQDRENVNQKAVRDAFMAHKKHLPCSY